MKRRNHADYSTFVVYHSTFECQITNIIFNNNNMIKRAIGGSVKYAFARTSSTFIFSVFQYFNCLG